MSENAIIQIPDDIKKIVDLVPTEKQSKLNEAICAITIVSEDFSTAIQEIIVNDINDTKSMNEADVLRKRIKEKRLEAEKAAKASRALIQERMSADKAEDTAWLRVIQYSDSKFKSLETEVENKAKYAEIKKKEEYELLKASRIKIIEENGLSGLNYDNIADMDESMFNTLIKGLLADRQEELRKSELFNQRQNTLTQFISFDKEKQLHKRLTVDTTEEEYKEILDCLIQLKNEFISEIENKANKVAEPIVEIKQEPNPEIAEASDYIALKNCSRFTEPYIRPCRTEEGKAVRENILQKFGNYKKWAYIQIETLKEG